MTQQPLSDFALEIFNRTYAINKKETWSGCARRTAHFVADGNRKLENKFFKIINDRKFIPGGRYLAQSGTNIPMVSNCFLFGVEDNRESWAELAKKAMMCLSTGGGIGVEYSKLRECGAPIKRFGGTAAGPISLMEMINDMSRSILAGAKRRSALWAGLNWQHPDIDYFTVVKQWDEAVIEMKKKNFDYPAPLDRTNISVGLDDHFFQRVGDHRSAAHKLYRKVAYSMCRYGEPGFSINVGEKGDEVLRNACTESTSADDSDVCNLGSINLARIEDINELEEVVDIATRFLYAGTFLGYVPHEDIAAVRGRNRRIGLGLMGLHEWLLTRNYRYEKNQELWEWLKVYQLVSDDAARKEAKRRKANKPIAVRAIAPTGTISICGETTSGIEPIFCVAYKRRYNKRGKWYYTYVVDPTADRLIENFGIQPDKIEDSKTLSEDVERRIAMQAFVQQFVDQGISSTINIPDWSQESDGGFYRRKTFADILLKYLPDLRGITVYPEGSRPGAPLTRVAYETAKKHRNVVVEESDETCAQGACGL